MALSIGRLGLAGLKKLFKLFELKNGPKRGKLDNPTNGMSFSKWLSSGYRKAGNSCV